MTPSLQIFYPSHLSLFLYWFPPFSLFLPHYFCQAASVTHSVTCLLPPFIPQSFLAKLLCFNTRQMLLKRGSPPSHSAFRFNSLPPCLSFSPLTPKLYLVTFQPSPLFMFYFLLPPLLLSYPPYLFDFLYLKFPSLSQSLSHFLPCYCSCLTPASLVMRKPQSSPALPSSVPWEPWATYHS